MNIKNTCTLIGHLGADPETRTLDSGAVVTTFSVATSEKYRNKAGEKVEQTEWHKVVAWNKLAEIARDYLKKGTLVAVGGKITYRSYEQDGQKKYITEIVASGFNMLSGTGQDNRSTEQDRSQPAPEPAQEGQPGDDLPF